MQTSFRNYILSETSSIGCWCHAQEWCETYYSSFVNFTRYHIQAQHKLLCNFKWSWAVLIVNFNSHLPIRPYRNRFKLKIIVINLVKYVLHTLFKFSWAILISESTKQFTIKKITNNLTNARFSAWNGLQYRISFPGSSGHVIWLRFIEAACKQNTN